MKTGHFMDKGNDSEGSSIKTPHFMDKRDDSEGSSIKTVLFMDRMIRLYKKKRMTNVIL